MEISKKYAILKNKKVLYIEDDIELQQDMVEVLKNFFNTIYTASEGEEAYDIFLEKEIDLMLVDINIPKLNGIEFIKLVREHNQTIPIAIISAYTSTDYLLDSVELGLIKYAVKPLTTNKIMQLLDKFINYFKKHDKIEIAKGIFLDKKENALFVNGEKRDLTKKESKFLELLSENRILSYEMIDYEVWGYDKTPTDNAIRSFIKKLRKKLPPNTLKNKQGVGYYLDVES